MLNVACVKWGTMYGPEYVNILYDSVRRNLAYGLKGRFVCFTDDPTGLEAGIETRLLPEGLKGWWGKLFLFSAEAFPAGERVLYFDLDTVIAGPIDALAAYQGPFAILRDVYRPNGLQSSVMAWEAGKCECFWFHWNRLGRPHCDGGDQEWIEHVFNQTGPMKPDLIPGYTLLQLKTKIDILQEIFPSRLKSYKVDCRWHIPKGCSVVFFHGKPRPHEVTEGWVPHVWKVGGGSGLEFIVQANVSDERLQWNVSAALRTCKEWLKPEKTHTGTALIVAGGPSLKDDLFHIRGRQMSHGKIFACGNAANYLLENHITPDYQVLLDARVENASFVVPAPTVKYLASQCAPETFEKADPKIGWHAMQTCYTDLVPKTDFLVGGGSTVGLKAVALAYALGFRHIHLFGFDSCYRENEHHAYPQALNDKERRIEAKAGGKTFECAPWMVTQAEEFKEIAPALVNLGCTLCVHGEGLIPTIAENLVIPPNTVDVRASEILKHLNGSEAPIGAEIGVAWGALSSRLLIKPNLRLYMIDPWKEASESYKNSGDFHADLSQEKHDEIYGIAQKAVAFAEGRALILRKDSLSAAEEIPDELLDFVFIDADHSYEAVKADIEAWWPKVKPGGFISGHDYEAPDHPGWGVKQAVTEFGTPELGADYTWFIRKQHEH